MLTYRIDIFENENTRGGTFNPSRCIPNLTTRPGGGGCSRWVSWPRPPRAKTTINVLVHEKSNDEIYCSGKNADRIATCCFIDLCHNVTHCPKSNAVLYTNVIFLYLGTYVHCLKGKRLSAI